MSSNSSTPSSSENKYSSSDGDRATSSSSSSTNASTSAPPPSSSTTSTSNSNSSTTDSSAASTKHSSGGNNNSDNSNSSTSSPSSSSSSSSNSSSNSSSSASASTSTSTAAKATSNTSSSWNSTPPLWQTSSNSQTQWNAPYSANATSSWWPPADAATPASPSASQQPPDGYWQRFMLSKPGFVTFSLSPIPERRRGAVNLVDSPDRRSSTSSSSSDSSNDEWSSWSSSSPQRSPGSLRLMTKSPHDNHNERELVNKILESLTWTIRLRANAIDDSSCSPSRRLRNNLARLDPEIDRSSSSNNSSSSSSSSSSGSSGGSSGSNSSSSASSTSNNANKDRLIDLGWTTNGEDEDEEGNDYLDLDVVRPSQRCIIRMPVYRTSTGEYHTITEVLLPRKGGYTLEDLLERIGELYRKPCSPQQFDTDKPIFQLKNSNCGIDISRRRPSMPMIFASRVEAMGGEVHIPYKGIRCVALDNSVVAIDISVGVQSKRRRNSVTAIAIGRQMMRSPITIDKNGNRHHHHQQQRDRSRSRDRDRDRDQRPVFAPASHTIIDDRQTRSPATQTKSNNQSQTVPNNDEQTDESEEIVDLTE